MKVLLDEFSNIMSEIELVYGEMNPNKLNTYFKYLGGFSREILQDAIKEVIQSSEDKYNRFPTIGRIYGEAAQLRSRRKIDGRPVHCVKCDSSGMIAVEAEKGQDLVFRCDCVNGNRYKKTLLLYDEEKHAPAEPIEKKLGAIEFSEIEKDRSLIFPEGATVIFTCKSDGCYQKYRVDYKRRISAAEIIDSYKTVRSGKAGGLCENCYYLAGKYYGFWI